MERRIRADEAHLENLIKKEARGEEVPKEEAVADPELTGVTHETLNSDLNVLNANLVEIGEKPLPTVEPKDPTSLETPHTQALAMFRENREVGAELIDDITTTVRTWGTSEVSSAVEVSLARIEFANRKLESARKRKALRMAEARGASSAASQS